MKKNSKIIIFDGYWKISDVKANPHWLFVYGDNNVRIGKGGQAIIRDLPNTIGIPTKKYPSNHPNSFYSDDDYIENIARITIAIENIIIESKNYKNVVLPADGFGTGFAQLPIKAPKTYKYLVAAIENLKNII